MHFTHFHQQHWKGIFHGTVRPEAKARQRISTIGSVIDAAIIALCAERARTSTIYEPGRFSKTDLSKSENE